jgi:dTMP kinase
MVQKGAQYNFDRPHPFPGKLIVVEGIDGSGKSTQLQLAYRWLTARGYRVFLTEWNSADLVKAVTKRGKKKMVLTPTTFSLVHATDFAHRLVYSIIPPLKAGMIVLADRFVFTAFARDVARGCHPAWVRKVYDFAIRPDVAFYFKVSLEVALDRITKSRAKLKAYEAGMDLGLHPDIMESFRIFQGRILDEYQKMIEEYGLTEMPAERPIDEQQTLMREIITQALAGVERHIERPESLAI